MKIVERKEYVRGGLFGLFGKCITSYTYVEDPFDPWSPEMAVIAAKVLRGRKPVILQKKGKEDRIAARDRQEVIWE